MITAREKLTSYLILGPFAIVLAFPFYWMLDELQDRARPLQRRERALRLLEGLADDEELHLPVRGDAVPDVGQEHGVRRADRGPDHIDPGRARRLRPRAPVGALGPGPWRDLPDLPRAADAALPAALRG